jgi:hypothetical protein
VIDTLKTTPARICVDPMPTGHVMLIAFRDDLEEGTVAIRLTPAVAARLGQNLIDVAARVETP